MEDADRYMKVVVEPEQAPEVISNAFLFCIIKGLHRAPRLLPKGMCHRGLGCGDIDFMVTPSCCWGPPHQRCLANGTKVIVVREDTTVLGEQVYPTDRNIVFVANYLEAAG